MQFTMTATIISSLKFIRQTNDEKNFVNETENFIFSLSIYWSFKIEIQNINVYEFF